MIPFVLNVLATVAVVITPIPVETPTVHWDQLDLDQQMAVIDMRRPDPEPIVLPVQRYAPPPRATVTPGVEQWRPLVASYFPADRVEWALAIMACESGGDPNAQHPGSYASGLFQHLPKYWEDRSTRAGWAGANIFDPTANVAVAAWLYTNGGPSHWVCKA